MPKILVTGGLGYIGSHTVTCLISAGYEPVIIDNLSNSTMEVLDRLNGLTKTNITFIKTEMCSISELNEVFVAHPDIVGVIHFAAWLQVNESVLNPTSYYRNNLLSTLNLIDVCIKHKITNIVFSSSCTVYGQPESVPVSENAPLKKAESPYGNTKAVGEQIFEDAAKAFKLKVLSLRYFNPIGAHETGLIGEVQHGAPHHLVPYITETASGKRKKLSVYGGDYNTSDGTCVRDYIHVMDIAEAHVLAIKHLSNQSNQMFDVINLGSGNGQTVLEMIKAFESTVGITVPYDIVGRRGGDVEQTFADITKAKKVLGWSPKRSLQEMMQSAWNWEQMQLKRD